MTNSTNYEKALAFASDIEVRETSYTIRHRQTRETLMALCDSGNAALDHMCVLLDARDTQSQLLIFLLDSFEENLCESDRTRLTEIRGALAKIDPAICALLGKVMEEKSDA